MLFSVALSAVLWMVISGQQNPYQEDVVQNVAVDVQNVPSDLVLRSGRATVIVRVSAPREAWRDIRTSTFRASVDASKVTAGRHILPVKVETSDWRVRVESWQPSSLEMEFEAAARKDVPVKVNVIGEVPFGYASQPATVSPQQVTISGPESLVAKVARVSVDVKLLDARSTVSEQLSPVPIDANGEVVKGVATSPEMVTVEVPVEQQVSYKTVAVLPRVVGSVAIGYQLAGLMVEPSTVTVVGDPNALRDLSYVETAPVNISGAKGDVTVSTKLELPASVSMVRDQGIVVRAYVGAAEGNQIVTVAPTITGLASKLVATCDPQRVEVTVAGPMPVLSTLKGEDVRVELNASGLGVGSHTLSPTVVVPDPLRVVAVNPSEVTVVLRR